MSTKLDANQILKRLFNENSDSLNVDAKTSGVPFTWDYVSMALSVGDTVETYTFRNGGDPKSSGAVVGTVIVTYTTSARSVLASVEVEKA